MPLYNGYYLRATDYGLRTTDYGLMKWLFRPSILMIVSAALAASAMALVLWPGRLEDKAVPLPVANGDQEVVWLYTATSQGPWERFLKGVDTAVKRLQTVCPDLGLELNTQSAFPIETTAVPEVTVAASTTRGRLRFRWYKLTSDQKTVDWVHALLQRRPPPLAIIGGSSSDLGIELARALKEETEPRGLGPASPLLLLTAATADDAPVVGDEPQPLISIYTGRTFRFCFTNRQMAEAVVNFIWGQDDLRPDSDPVYLTFWKDDPYSKDLMPRYLEALQLPATKGAVWDWCRLAGFAVVGGLPLDATLLWGQFRHDTPYSTNIPYSVGTFGRPNRWEVEEGGRLIEYKLEHHPQQRRPLLVLPAATQPSRRFLRALVRFAPEEARRFVVASGDALTFNTLYRDRNFAWSIQDLPFSLVCFFHRNPVDTEAGFLPESASRNAEAGAHASLAGTDDLLVYVDILDAVVRGSFCAGAGRPSAALPANGSELKEKLSQAGWSKTVGRVSFDPASPRLFDEKGDRCSSTGEHIVTLRPLFGQKGKEVLPAATIDVWAWQTRSSNGERHWRQQASLPVHYDGYLAQESP
jgi:hypothetical protein